MMLNRILANDKAVYYSTKVERWIIRDLEKRRYISLSHEDVYALRIALSCTVVEGDTNLSISKEEGLFVIRAGTEEELKRKIDYSKYHKLEDFGIGDNDVEKE